MVDVLVSYIPLIIVLVFVISLAVFHFKYRRTLRKMDTYFSCLGWSMATCMFAVLVTCLWIEIELWAAL